MVAWSIYNRSSFPLTVGGAVGFEEGDAVGIFCVIRMQQLGYKDSDLNKKETKRSMHNDL